MNIATKSPDTNTPSQYSHIDDSTAQLYELITQAVREVLSQNPIIVERPLNETEAAQQLGVQPQTMAVWRSRGKGPAYFKSGKSVRYRPRDVRDYIKKNLVVG